MLKKSKSLTIVLIIAISLFATVSQHVGYAQPPRVRSGSSNASTNTSSVTTTNSVGLKIYLGPSSVPADNGSYNCIFVQLWNSSGEPVIATANIVVGLSSSQTNIGTVQPSMTITKGGTYAQTSFHTTLTPGTTIISASATGLTTVTAAMTTVAPIPSKVVVYGLPSTLPADGGTYAAILVQLQDSNGNPAKAPSGGVQVALSCSDVTDVGSVTPIVTIPEGATYATANFTTVVATDKIWSASVTGIAQGYTPVPLTITTTPVGSNPNQIKIFTGPSQIPADDNSYPIALELQNSTGFVCKLPSDTSVSTSSLNLTVATINSPITIPSGQAYALANLTTTYEPGATTLYAAANNFGQSTASITTNGFTPQKLVVFCVPPALPADGGTYDAITVQLQDVNGNPARDPTSQVTVSLTSLQPNVGTVTSTLTIPLGQTQATGNITVTNSPGTTQITALSSNYQNGQATITTYLLTEVATSASTGSTKNATQTSSTPLTAPVTIQLRVTDSSGKPLSNAEVELTSQPAGAVPFSALTNSTGYIVFKDAPEGEYMLKITKSGYGQIYEPIYTRGVPVSLTLMLSHTGTPFKFGLSTILIIVVPVVVAVIVVILLVRRRSSSAPEPNPQATNDSQQKLDTSSAIHSFCLPLK